VEHTHRLIGVRRVEQTAGFFDCRRSRSPLSRQVHSDHREQTVKSEERTAVSDMLLLFNSGAVCQLDSTTKLGNLGSIGWSMGLVMGRAYQVPLGTQCAETKDLYNTILLLIFPNNFGLISND